MEETFERYWEYAQAVVRWTNALLLPPPEHVQQLLGAAATVEGVGKAFANGFDDPRTCTPGSSIPGGRQRRTSPRSRPRNGVTAAGP